MKKIVLASITAIGISFCLNAATVKADFTKPMIVQNYPTNNTLSMDGAPYSYNAINELIDSAVKTIDIEMFYINNEKKDSKLDTHIIKPLIAKAKSGVKIRILVDDGMANHYPDEVKHLNTIKNIEVRRTKYFNKNGVLHAKMILVDDETFYLGSHNFDWITFELNHELGVIYSDKSLTPVLRKVFEFDWKNTTSKTIAATQPASLDDKETIPDYLITLSPADIESIASDKAQIVKLINNAKDSIEMQAMVIDGYNVYNKNAEWTDFVKAIAEASNRGVKVKLMFSNWEFCKGEINNSNKFLQNLIRGDAKKNIEIKYSSFSLAVPCVPYSEVDHAKYAIFDGKIAWITTANLTENYFNGCRNFSLTSYSNPALAEQLSKIFFTMWDSKYMTVYKDEVTKITNNTCNAFEPKK